MLRLCVFSFRGNLRTSALLPGSVSRRQVAVVTTHEEGRAYAMLPVPFAAARLPFQASRDPGRLVEAVIVKRTLLRMPRPPSRFFRLAD